MWELYSYTVLLLIVMLLIIYILLIMNKLPFKIRVSVIAVFLTFFMRYISLFVMLMAVNIRYLYVVKPLYFLNLIYMPIAALVLFYIFLRSDRLNFSYIFLICGILCVLYYALMVMSVCYIHPSLYFGYVMDLGNGYIINWVYVLVNTFILFVSALSLSRKEAIRFGLVFMIIASLISIIESISVLTCLNLYPSFIISDLIWIMCFVYGIRKIKR